MTYNEVIMLLLVAAVVLSSIKTMTGPSVWDRLLGLSLVSSKFVILIVLYATQHAQGIYLDIALVYALLGFVGLTSLAKFLQKRRGE